MKLNKSIFYLPILIALSAGCAKTGYLIEQGIGQLKILNKAQPNKEILEDIKVPSKYKDQIKEILKYKKFFYSYFGRKETEIYNKTTLLDRPAVSYLVIVSPHYEIKAEKECFPFMGCFPYLGFFSKESANEYAKEKEAEDFVTYVRPVYAYSTLGYFTDTILSSFFYYDEYEMAEMIFHELFHTIFFPKDEVDLNENMANFFAGKLVQEYFKLSPKDVLKRDKEKKNHDLLKSKVLELLKNLNSVYKEKRNTSKEESQKTLGTFLETKFNPAIQLFCEQNKISKRSCFPLDREWNNASFAAFLTYEKNANHIDQLYRRLNLPLKEFLSYIEKKEKEFEKSDQKSFAKFLFK